MSPKVGIELGVDIHCRRLSCSVLDHQEELGDNLDDMAGLEDKVAFLLHSFRGQAARDVGLRP